MNFKVHYIFLQNFTAVTSLLLLIVRIFDMELLGNIYESISLMSSELQSSLRTKLNSNTDSLVTVIILL